MFLNKDNYYSIEANREYLSVSQFKGFLPSYGGCEARSMAELAGEYTRPDKTAFDEGHYLHSWNEGTLDEFKANNPDLYSSRGPTAGQLKSNFKHCDKMIATLESDELVMKVLAGQKEVIRTAELFGAKWKIMMDSYQQGLAFADLKAIKDMSDKFWNGQIYENFVDHYGYNVQMGVYAEIERRSSKSENWLLPHMVVVTKQDPPDKDIYYFDFNNIQAGLNIVENNIGRVLEVKSGRSAPVRCEKCDYCRGTKKIKTIKHVSELSLY